MNKCFCACLVFVLAAFAAAQDNWQNAELVEDIQHTAEDLWVKDGASAVDMADHLASWSPSYRFKADPSFLESDDDTAATVTTAATPATTTTTAATPATTTAAATDATTAATTTSTAAAPATTTTAATPATTTAAPATTTTAATPATTTAAPATTTTAATPVTTTAAPATTTTAATPATTTTATPVANITANAPTYTCNAQTCVNGGKCSDNVCVCVVGSGWEGPNCATKSASLCHDVICRNGGKCQEETGVCQCWGNFSGSRCETAPPAGQECVNVNCLNGGSCKNGFCACINNFTGIRCENDPCDNITCMNEGRCEAGKCHCKNNFSGSTCEKDPCDKIRCRHGGKCVAGSCQCTPHWEGATCQYSMKTSAPLTTAVPMIPAFDSCACANSPSVNCVTLAKNNTCPDGTPATVTHVKETVSLAGVSQLYPCHSIPCRNGGKCLHGKCRCKKGFTGSVCETDLCDSVNCNGGVCKSGQCFCDAGREGKFCEIDKCSKINCQNGGTCSEGMCVCSENFAGKYCERASWSGRKLKNLNTMIDKASHKITRLNNTIPVYQEVIKMATTQGALTNGTEIALDEAQAIEQVAKDDFSNHFSHAPRLLMDSQGHVNYHNGPLAADLKEDIDAVAIPNHRLRTDFRSLYKAAETGRNYTDVKNQFMANMTAAEKIGLVETGSTESVDLSDMAEAEAETETEADDEAEADTEADDEADESFLEVDADAEDMADAENEF